MTPVRLAPDSSGPPRTAAASPGTPEPAVAIRAVDRCRRPGSAGSLGAVGLAIRAVGRSRAPDPAGSLGAVGLAIRAADLRLRRVPAESPAAVDLAIRAVGRSRAPDPAGSLGAVDLAIRAADLRLRRVPAESPAAVDLAIPVVGLAIPAAGWSRAPGSAGSLGAVGPAIPAEDRTAVPVPSTKAVVRRAIRAGAQPVAVVGRRDARRQEIAGESPRTAVWGHPSHRTAFGSAR